LKHKITYLADSLLLAGLCLLFFWRNLTPVLRDRLVFAPGDFSFQFFAFARYETARLAHGELPLWNPALFSGHPFIADIQSAVFYPLSLLTMLLTAARGFTYHTLELEAIAHFGLAAIFTYLLARRLTQSRVGGLIAAVTFTFGGYLTSYPPLQLAILETQVWLPLILLLLDLAGARLAAGDFRAGLAGTLGAGLLLGVALLAGHPQSGLLVGYASVAFGVFRFWPQIPTDRRAWLRGGLLLLVMAVVAVGIAAVQLLPSAEFLVRSIRMDLGFEEAGRGFMPFDLLQLILPAIGGQFPALYLGILPPGLAAFALLIARRDPRLTPDTRRTIGFLGWALLIGLLLIFGKFAGLYQVFYLLAPGWSLFRGQERVVFWVALAVALLAGYGAAWLARQPALACGPSGPGRDAMRTDQSATAPEPVEGTCPELVEGAFRQAQGLARAYFIGAAAALILALAFFVGYQAGREALWGFTSAVMWLALLLALTGIILRTRRPALLLAIVLLDLFTANATHYAASPDRLSLQPLQPLMAFAQADPEIFRVASDDVVSSNYALLYALEEIKGASPLQLRDYEEWLRRVPTPRAWRLLNVKYVFSWLQELDAPAERLAEMPGREGKPVYVYRLREIGPRAWLTGRVIVEPGREQTLARLAAADFPADHIILPSLPPGFSGADACDGQIVWKKRAPERLELDVTTRQPCILVLGELNYPGWRATVDGSPAPILPADLIFRAVALAPGAHTVHFSYRPDALILGAAFSIGTLALAVAGILLATRSRRAT
jgi:hypothetical protein